VWLVIQKTFGIPIISDFKRLKEKWMELIMWLLKCSFDNAKYFEFVDKARAMGITLLFLE
jgi:hypothetical protein